MKRVLVMGASGEMGRRVMALAQRLLPDVALVAGVHRHPVNSGRESVQVDVFTSPGDIARSLEGIDAVINAVGPYDYDPQSIIEACLEARCHYVDLAERPDFIERVQHVARLLFDAPSAPCVVAGASTLPGLVQALAQQWNVAAEIASVRVFLSVGSRNPPSTGLMYSLLSPLGDRAPGGGRYFTQLSRKRFWGDGSRLHGRFPSPFGARGLSLAGRHVQAEVWVGLDRAAWNLALLGASLPAHLMPDPWIKRLSVAAVPWARAAGVLGTRRGFLSIEGRDEQRRMIAEIQVSAQREGLNLPALPAVWAVRKLLDEEFEAPAGPVSLDRIMTFAEATEWLQQEGYGVEVWRRERRRPDLEDEEEEPQE